jgi:putative ABC transport system permease protein
MTPAGRLKVDGEARQFASTVSFIAVDDRYFATMGLTITSGRAFLREEALATSPVAIVSTSLARAIAGSADPLGRRLGLPHPTAPPLEIIGTVPDMITRLDVMEPLVAYLPMRQPEHTSVDFVVRAASSTTALAAEIQGAIRGLDPAVTPSSIRTLEERIVRQMAPQRFAGVVLATLGLVSLVLTALGTFVLAETMTTLRMQEMGIRAALGASPVQLARMTIVETARYVGIGLLVGLVVASLATNVVRAFLFQVEPLDPAALTIAALAILSMGLLISLKPALRAARVDLTSTLRA